MASDRKQYQAEYYQKRKALKSLPTGVNTPPNVKSTPKPRAKQSIPSNTIVENYITETAPVEDSTSLNMVNLRKILKLCLLGFFLVANTAFLVNEQMRFYTLKGESTWYALGVSLLSEGAVILLSFFYAETRDIFRKIKLGIILALTVITIISFICLGVQKSQSQEEKNAEISTLMRKEIEHAKADAKGAKVERKEEELRKFLQANSIASLSGMESFSLVALRFLSLSWNIVFAALIAFVLRGAYKPS